MTLFDKLLKLLSVPPLLLHTPHLYYRKREFLNQPRGQIRSCAIQELIIIRLHLFDWAEPIYKYYS